MPTSRDYRGHFLLAKLHEKKEIAAESVTVENLVEQIEALEKTSTHSAISAVTFGEHFMSHDIFKSVELSVKVKRIKALRQN